MVFKKNPPRLTLPQRQEHLLRNPQLGIKEDQKRIYKRNEIKLGWPEGAKRIFEHLARRHTVAIVGVALGDEGKGRLVDNKIEALLALPQVKLVNVVRYNGGNNTGHTLEIDGLRLGLHLVPSGILYEKTVGIMDRGMVIHPEDLRTEVEHIEEKIGDLREKLLLSNEAILCTDLERAEELLNGLRTGRAKGGTGRGISPAYAHHYDRRGLKIYDFLYDNWRETLGRQYDCYKKEFSVFEVELASVSIPDLKATYKEGKEQRHLVGSKKEFLDRLGVARAWLFKRKMTTNTFLVHRSILDDFHQGVIFEGAQALGLDAWLGTRPDVTSSNTSISGVREGTAWWKTEDIEKRIGVFKVTYTSSVGVRRMPTHVDLPNNLEELPKEATPEQRWAAFVRKTANEYGTTTGRPRDINKLDLPLLVYNARMSGIEVLAGTHLDIAREEPIEVCTHYTDKNGGFVPYQPGLRYQEGVVPHYIQLPGWEGEACRKAKKISGLPENALKFLAFIQARTGFPIVVVTTGPLRRNLLALPGY